VLLDEDRTVPQVMPSGQAEASSFADPTLTPSVPIGPAPVEAAAVHDFGAPLEFASVEVSPEASPPAAGPQNGAPSRPSFVGSTPSDAAVDDWEPHLETDLVATVAPGKQLAIGAVVALAVGLALFLLFRLGMKLYRQGNAGTSAAYIQGLVRPVPPRTHLGARSFAPGSRLAWGQMTRPSVPHTRRPGTAPASIPARLPARA
jgi:hypothetical protein